MTVRSKQLLFRLNIQVTPYVFNAYVFQNLLDQKFFETYDRKDEKLISLMTNKLWSFFVTLGHLYIYFNRVVKEDNRSFTSTMRLYG
jgi:hypothetical protein